MSLQLLAYQGDALQGFEEDGSRVLHWYTIGATRADGESLGWALHKHNSTVCVHCAK